MQSKKNYEEFQRYLTTRNYRLKVALQKCDVLKNTEWPEKPSFEGEYASFKNIKFPRVNYHTDSSET